MPTNTTSKPVVRLLAWDLSLASPGAAVIEIKNGNPTVLAVSHVKTDAKLSMALRGKLIEGWARLFIAAYHKKGFDYVVREKYSGSFGHHPIYTAHVACDRAMHDFGITDTDKPIAQQSVKKKVVGKGKAEKHEVEESVRRLTGYDGEFKTSDESDAVAIGLACAIDRGLIKEDVK